MLSTDVVLLAYGFNSSKAKIEMFGKGLINNTWKLYIENNIYILQRINQHVFKTPFDIEYNIKMVGQYLKKNHPDYTFVSPIASLDGREMIYLKQEGYFRIFPFVPGSHSIDVVSTPSEAFEAALQFGKFTKLLAGMDINQLKTTIPSFHDLTLRYQQFIAALENGNSQRIKQSEELIKFLKRYETIVKQYDMIKANPFFRLRVTHHDTKISNVLFDDSGKGICVIDLDTVMPGYFISDVGDMMRTYLSPVNEEEQDLSKISIRDEYYTAIVKGYYNQMKDELTDEEKNSFFYAGTYMIYMQALRFLTDFINDDVYYKAKYAEHNFNRANNQVILLQKLLDKENVLRNIRLPA